MLQLILTVLLGCASEDVLLPHWDILKHAMQSIIQKHKKNWAMWEISVQICPWQTIKVLSSLHIKILFIRSKKKKKNPTDHTSLKLPKLALLPFMGKMCILIFFFSLLQSICVVSICVYLANVINDIAYQRYKWWPALRSLFLDFRQQNWKAYFQLGFTKMKISWEILGEGRCRKCQSATTWI